MWSPSTLGVQPRVSCVTRSAAIATNSNALIWCGGRITVHLPQGHRRTNAPLRKPVAFGKTKTSTLTRQGFGEGQGQKDLRAQESRWTTVYTPDEVTAAFAVCGVSTPASGSTPALAAASGSCRLERSLLRSGPLCGFHFAADALGQAFASRLAIPLFKRVVRDLSLDEQLGELATLRLTPERHENAVSPRARST